MSSGHTYSTKVPAHSAAVLSQVLANPQIQARLKAPVQVDRSHDIPYLAGYSADAKTIYIDRALPPRLPIGKGTFDPTPFLLAHEKIEKAVIDTLGWTYDHAHQLASNYERRLVLQAGLDWKAYQDAFEGHIKTDEHKQLQQVPGDLDMTPYVQDGNKELIGKMRSAMAQGPAQ